MKWHELARTTIARIFLGELALLGLVVVLSIILSPDPGLIFWIAAGSLVAALVVTGILVNRQRQNSLTGPLRRYRRGRVEGPAVEVEEVKLNHIAEFLAQHPPVNQPDEVAYEVNDPRFILDLNTVTSADCTIRRAHLHAGVIGGSGKSSVTVHDTHMERFLGMPGNSVIFEINPNGVGPVIVNMPETDKCHTALLNNYDSITCMADLLKYMEFTDMGIPVLPYGGRALTPDDLDKIMILLFKYFSDVHFDADNALDNPHMAAALRWVKQTGGVVVYLITNKINSHVKARKANLYLEALGVKYFNVVNCIELKATNDAEYEACALADQFKVPVRIIEHVAELNLVITFLRLLSESSRRHIGHVTATRIALANGIEVEREPDHPLWESYKLIKAQRDEQDRLKAEEASGHEVVNGTATVVDAKPADQPDNATDRTASQPAAPNGQPETGLFAGDHRPQDPQGQWPQGQPRYGPPQGQPYPQYGPPQGPQYGQGYLPPQGQPTGVPAGDPYAGAYAQVPAQPDKDATTDVPVATPTPPATQPAGDTQVMDRPATTPVDPEATVLHGRSPFEPPAQTVADHTGNGQVAAGAFRRRRGGATAVAETPAKPLDQLVMDLLEQREMIEEATDDDYVDGLIQRLVELNPGIDINASYHLEDLNIEGLFD